MHSPDFFFSLTVTSTGTEEVQRGTSTDLILSEVTFSDDDKYTCTLIYPQGEISSDPVDVHVRGTLLKVVVVRGGC